MKIPFWLLRLKKRGTIDFNGGQLELDDLKLTVEDLYHGGVLSMLSDDTAVSSALVRS